MQALCFNTIDHKICFTVLPLTNNLDYIRDLRDNYSNKTVNKSNIINKTNSNIGNNSNNKNLRPLGIEIRQLNNQNITSRNAGIQQLNNQNIEPLSTQTTLSEFFAGGFNKFITDTVINTANRFGYILTNPVLSFFTTTFLSLLIAYITSYIIGPYTSGGANAVLRDWDTITIPFSNYLTQIIKNNISFLPNSIVNAIVTSTISYIYTLFSRLGFDIVQFLISPSLGSGFNVIGNSVSNLVNPDLSNLDIGF